MVTGDGRTITDARAQVGSICRHLRRSRQGGISSGEFALTVFIIAVAILAGVLGGIWIAEREGLVRGQASALKEAADSPVEKASVAASEQIDQAFPPSTSEADRVDTATPLAAVTPLGLRSIRAIHYSSRPDLARVEIEVENAVLVRAAQLHNPERVYFDLQDSQRSPGQAGRMLANRTVSIGKDLLAGVRITEWESGATRIVLDLKRSCEFSHRLTPEPSPRLIVEVRPRASATADVSARNEAH